MTGTSWRTPLKVAFTFAGTSIGAGFASGQELLQFFFIYGSYGFISICFAGILFGILCWRLLAVSRSFQLDSYSDLTTLLCGPKIGRFFTCAISAFFFAVLVIMLAAAADTAAALSVPAARFAPFIFSLLLFFVALGGIRRITKISCCITPLLAAAIAAVCLSSLSYHCVSLHAIQIVPDHLPLPDMHWLTACILYVSCNLILSTTVLIPLGRSLKNRRAQRNGSFIGGLLLAALSALIGATLLAHAPMSFTDPLPILTISCSQNNYHTILYAAAFFCAMSTTSLSCLYGSAIRLSKALPIPYPISLILTLAAALLLSTVGFRSLIAIVFPVFGMFSLWLIIRLMEKSLESNVSKGGVPK